MDKTNEKCITSIMKIRASVKIFFPAAAKRFPLFFWLEAIKMLIGIAQPFVAVLVTPLIVDELIGDKDLHRLIIYAAVLILGEFILTVSSELIGNSLKKYQQRLDNHFSILLGEHAMQMDFPLTEDKEVLDQLEKARTGLLWYSGGAYGIAEEIFGLAKNVIRIGGFVAILAMNAPLLLIVMLLYIIINTLLTIKVNRIEVKAFSELSKENRLFEYFGWNIVDIRYGKDIRLYGAQDMMKGAWEDASNKTLKADKWQADSTLPCNFAMSVLNVIRTIFAYFYVGLLAIRGEYSIGTFTQLIESESALDVSLSGIVGNVLGLAKRCNYAYEFVKFMEIPTAIPKGNVMIEKKPHEIEFRNVSFAYPNSERKVLDNVNLKVKAGEHIALVGRNGAGKTTLIKLLCRLYDPTEGEILVDGRDIREYDYKQYMEQFAPVFQDYRLFAMTIKENIAFDKPDDEEALGKMIRSVGLDDMIGRLEKKTDTVIMKYFDDAGIEPSGGESQKIAIARALYKESPAVIMDEPTSALDPLAEYEIYKNFSTLVGNKTAFYISHRLSSCRFCDNIAVFDHGTVREYGNHDTLMKISDGLYAEMFEAQAKYYKS